MKEYVKQFFLRGMMFAGFGPIILGIIYLILQKTVDGFSLSGSEAFVGIISIYLLAFVHAGVSIFNQIPHWPVMKSLFFHFLSLYIVYVVCYLINSWIPFDLTVILIFTAIFVVAYFVVWFIVYFSVRSASKKMSRKLS